MNNQDSEQLSFLLPKDEDDKKEPKINPPYDPTICGRCLCNKCSNSCEGSIFLMTREEWKNQETCFNCDDCYFYGMDNPELSQHIVKFECKNFKLMNYYVELNAKENRKNIKIVR